MDVVFTDDVVLFLTFLLDDIQAGMFSEQSSNPPPANFGSANAAMPANEAHEASQMIQPPLPQPQQQLYIRRPRQRRPMPTSYEFAKQHLVPSKSAAAAKGIARPVITHTAMDGTSRKMFTGCRIDTTDLLRTFWRHYANDIAGGHYLYFIENAGFPEEPSKLYFDLDLFLDSQNPDDLTLADALPFWQAVYRIVVACLDEADQQAAKMIVLAPDISAVQKDNIQCVKVGVHLVFPTVFLRTTKRLQLRGHLIDCLSSLFGTDGKISIPFGDKSVPAIAHSTYGTWNSIVDVAVMKHVTSRMVESRKFGPCGCDEKSACNHSTRKKDVGRQMKFQFVMDSNGRDDTLTQQYQNLTELLPVCSIVLPGPEASIHFPQSFLDKWASQETAPKRGRPSKKGRLAPVADDSQHDKIIQIISDVLSVHFDGIRIKEDSLVSGSQCIQVQISNYFCWNVKKAHNCSPALVEVSYFLVLL